MPDQEFGKSLDSLAQLYADELVEFQPTGVFVLGGYCIGAVIALAIANNLRARGREVGPLICVDGAPENTSFELRGWHPDYWLQLMRNLYGWVNHADLMRSRTLRSLIWSITNNMSAISKGVFGLNRAEKIGGGYAIESIMDVSRFQPTQIMFINRLLTALFKYTPTTYAGEVIVYEAAVKPLLRLPQIGRIWSKLVSSTRVVEITGTHISMMHEPYVDALAIDLKRRLSEYFAGHLPS